MNSSKAGTAASTDHGVVLFVDLDGSLLKTDLLQEGIVKAFRLGVGFALQVTWLLLRDRAAGKRLLAERVSFDVHRLPVRQEVLDCLESQKQQGTTLVLATASDQHWAAAIASSMGLFSDVIASDGKTNLKGKRKLAAIEDYCRQHDFGTFDYLGDSRADIPILQQARKAYIVGSGLPALFKLPQAVRLRGLTRSRTTSIWRLIRPQQWVKNLLIFVPLVLAHDFSNVEKWLQALLGFFAFSLCASGVYVINDLFDIESDRHHPRKHRRPFAAADLPIAWGPPIALVCLAVAFCAGLLLPAGFFLVLAAYVVLTTLYSTWLKRIAIIDVLVLSSLYSIRIAAGGQATETDISEWLVGFSLFFFLSLAFAKRYAELKRLATEDATDVKGRGYQVADWSLIESIGPTSGYLAVLVFALYIHSGEMRQLYGQGWSLWLVCPLLLYWITRIWLKANRQELTEDPILFAVKDRVSWLVGALILLLALISRPF